jgi:hypothetical protein
MKTSIMFRLLASTALVGSCFVDVFAMNANNANIAVPSNHPIMANVTPTSKEVILKNTDNLGCNQETSCFVGNNYMIEIPRYFAVRMQQYLKPGYVVSLMETQTVDEYGQKLIELHIRNNTAEMGVVSGMVEPLLPLPFNRHIYTILNGPHIHNSPKRNTLQTLIYALKDEYALRLLFGTYTNYTEIPVSLGIDHVTCGNTSNGNAH